MELIYTDRATGFEKGKHYRNPRYFDRVEKAAKSVVIEGNWPKVKAAYEKAGVKVDDGQNDEAKSKPASKTSRQKSSVKE